MNYTIEYKKLLINGATVSKNNIKPGNIYKIKSYSGGEADSDRYVFVIGKVDDTIHCLKLNEIKSKDFITFLTKIVDNRIKLKDDTKLNEIVKKFKKDGSDLFERYVKGERKVYSKKLNSYRVYKLSKILSMNEMHFKPSMLKTLLDTSITESVRNIEVQDEIQENG